jgi:hypothetical protein
MAPIATALHDDPVQTAGGKAKMSSEDIMSLEHQYSAYVQYASEHTSQQGGRRMSGLNDKDELIR